MHVPLHVHCGFLSHYAWGSPGWVLALLPRQAEHQGQWVKVEVEGLLPVHIDAVCSPYLGLDDRNRFGYSVYEVCCKRLGFH